MPLSKSHTFCMEYVGRFKCNSVKILWSQTLPVLLELDRKTVTLPYSFNKNNVEMWSVVPLPSNILKLFIFFCPYLTVQRQDKT